MLDEISRYIELADTNRFKALAFQRAAEAIESIDGDIEALIRGGQLYATPGVGKAIGPIIVEMAESGSSSYLEELRSQYPPGIFDLMRIPKLGLRKIGALHSQLGVESLDQLEQACRQGRVARMKGFGEKTQEKILEGIAWARTHESQFLLPTGIETGEWLKGRLARIPSVEAVEVAGSVRRRLEVVSNVNIVIVTDDREATIAALAEIVENLTPLDDGALRGRVRGEIDVLFQLTTSAGLAATMLLATGSAEFVEAFRSAIAAKDYELRDGTLLHHGKHVALTDERTLFEKAGIAWVEPERRESAADLKKKKRTALVDPSDLRGTFHVHSTYSDGRNSILEMLEASRDRGFEYVGISDHSQNASYAGGLTESRLRDQHAEIDSHRKDVAPMRVFRGTEADILNDGSMDYGPSILPMFDFVIASVHSKFGMPQDEMTERILRALDDPHVTFLGHMTGRLLLSRPGYTFDYDRIFERAGERGVIIEINGNPNRLDIDWRLIRRAADRGVIFSINPDAHSIRELEHVVSGTWVARKGGLSPEQIFNTRPAGEVAEFFELRRSARDAK